MGARTGQEYIEGLRDGRSIYVNGELVHDVTQHPPFRGVIQLEEAGWCERLSPGRGATGVDAKDLL